MQRALNVRNQEVLYEWNIRMIVNFNRCGLLNVYKYK